MLTWDISGLDELARKLQNLPPRPGIVVLMIPGHEHSQDSGIIVVNTSSGVIEIDHGKRKASIGGSQLALSRSEFEVLTRLAQGQVVSRTDLQKAANAASADAVRDIVKRLRKKGLPIITRRAFGYTIDRLADRVA